MKKRFLASVLAILIVLQCTGNLVVPVYAGVGATRTFTTVASFAWSLPAGDTTALTVPASVSAQEVWTSTSRINISWDKTSPAEDSTKTTTVQAPDGYKISGITITNGDKGTVTENSRTDQAAEFTVQAPAMNTSSVILAGSDKSYPASVTISLVSAAAKTTDITIGNTDCLSALTVDGTDRLSGGTISVTAADQHTVAATPKTGYVLNAVTLNETPLESTEAGTYILPANAEEGTLAFSTTAKTVAASKTRWEIRYASSGTKPVPTAAEIYESFVNKTASVPQLGAYSADTITVEYQASILSWKDLSNTDTGLGKHLFGKNDTEKIRITAGGVTSEELTIAFIPTVTFTKGTYENGQVTLQDGTWAENGTYTVDYSESASTVFTVTPDEGYRAETTVGAYDAAAGTLTVPNTGAAVITVEFTKDPMVTLNVTAESAAVTVDGVACASGASVSIVATKAHTVVVTPNEGCGLTSILLGEDEQLTTQDDVFSAKTIEIPADSTAVQDSTKSLRITAVKKHIALQNSTEVYEYRYPVGTDLLTRSGAIETALRNYYVDGASSLPAITDASAVTPLYQCGSELKIWMPLSYSGSLYGHFGSRTETVKFATGVTYTDVLGAVVSSACDVDSATVTVRLTPETTFALDSAMANGSLTADQFNVDTYTDKTGTTVGTTTFTVVPDTGYVLVGSVYGVSADGATVTPTAVSGNQVTFSNEKNLTLYAQFEKDTRSVTVSSDHATVTASDGTAPTVLGVGTANLSSQTDFTFTVTPEEGYAVTSVTLNGTAVYSTNTAVGTVSSTALSFQKGTTPVTIAVSCTKIQTVLTATSFTLRYPYADSQSLTEVLWENDRVKASVYAELYTLLNTETTYPKTTADFSNVTVEYLAGITLSGSQWQELSVKPDSTLLHAFGNLSVAGSAMETIRFRMADGTVSENVALSFTPTVTFTDASTDANGSLSPFGADKTKTVDRNLLTATQFSAVPADGYIVKSYQVDGVKTAVYEDNTVSFQVSNSQNHTLSADFLSKDEVRWVDVSLTNGDSSTVSGLSVGKNLLEAQTDYEVSVVPAAGLGVKEVKLNGTSLNFTIGTDGLAHIALAKTNTGSYAAHETLEIVFAPQTVALTGTTFSISYLDIAREAFLPLVDGAASIPALTAEDIDKVSVLYNRGDGTFIAIDQIPEEDGTHAFGDKQTETIRFAYQTAVSANVAVTIRKEPTTVVLKETELTTVYGQENASDVLYNAIDWEASVLPDGLGKDDFTYTCKNTLLYLPLSDTPDAGTYTVKVIYGGSKAYESSEAQGTLTVEKAPCKIVADNGTMTYGEEVPNLVVTDPAGISTLTIYTGLDSNLEGFVSLILPSGTLGDLIGSAIKEMTVSQMLDYLETFAGESAIASIRELLPENVLNLKVAINQKPTETGAYAVISLTVDGNYETAAAVGGLVVKPITEHMQLSFNGELPNGQLLQKTFQETYENCLGGYMKNTETGEAVEAAKVKAVYTGVTADGMSIPSTQIDLQNLKPGLYTETLIVTGGNYYAAPAVRTFLVVEEYLAAVSVTTTAITYGQAVPALVTTNPAGLQTMTVYGGMTLNGDAFVSISGSADAYDNVKAAYPDGFTIADDLAGVIEASKVADGAELFQKIAEAVPEELKGAAVQYDVTPKDAGIYTVLGVITEDDYAHAFNVGTLTILPDSNNEVRFNQEITELYQKDIAAYDFGAKVFVKGTEEEVADNIHMLWVGVDSFGNPVSAIDPAMADLKTGVYTQTAYTLGGNFAAVPQTRTVTIKRQDCTVTFPGSTERTFDGTAFSPEFALKSQDGISVTPAADAVNVTYLQKVTILGNELLLPMESAPTDVGSYRMTVAFLGDEIYAPAVGTIDYSISQAQTIIEADDMTADYDGAEHPVTDITVTPGAAEADVVYYDASGSLSVPVHAGTYTCKITVAGTDNYTAAEKTITVTIDKAPLTVAVESQSKTAGEEDPAASFTVVGLKGTDENVVHVEREPGETCGTYALTAVLDSSDYEMSAQNGALTIDHNYTAVVTAPTCTERGYTTHTCSCCGDSYKDTYVDALGHDDVAVVTAPTFTTQGYTTHTCSRGDNSYVDSYVAALEHLSSTVYPKETEMFCQITRFTQTSAFLDTLNYGREHVSVFGNDGTGIGELQNLGTGMTVQLTYGGTMLETLTLVVSGDVNCDTNVNVADILQIRAHILAKQTLTGAPAKAANLVGTDAGITISDLLKVQAIVLQPDEN